MLFELVTGNLAAVPSYMAALNIGWIYVLYLAAFAVCGRTRIAVPLVSVSLYLISLAEAFVVAFRGRPIMFWDVFALRTAMSVSGNYSFVITRAMKLAFLGLLAVNLLAWVLPLRVKGRKQRLLFAGGSAGLAVGFGLWFFGYLAPAWGLGINMWAVNETYQEYGYVLSTAVSFRYAVKKKPEGYSQARIRQIYEEIIGEDEELLASNGDVGMNAEGDITPVNIICIMNESLADLKTAGDFETNREYFPFLNSLEENAVRGSLCVPVFGSMTSNTEFEFLTGDSMALLPSNCIAYQFYIHPGTYGLTSTLKDQGYRPVVVHPYPRENWNRDESYRNMGFDDFLDIEDFEGSGELRNYVSDRANYEKLIELVEAKENPSDRLFLFNVTMQNHGGYESAYENFDQEIWLTGDLEGKYPKTDQFLSLMKASDDALEYLIGYFEQSGEPTMIVMFGDHQPSVEDGFFDEIAGQPSEQVPDSQRIMWYETPFLIWTNYEMKSEDKGSMGAVYLSSEVLKRAGLSMTPFNRFMLEMEEQLPVIHPLGCYDREGNYYTWEAVAGEQSPYRKLMSDYQCLVYNHCFDANTYEKMFTVPGT
ncbi:arylsulfatase [[Clostridium] asparagiforme DSM 15981]|uniref:Arylsulfatase n=1 Tax=[Clostridium] asparagiforme DSM 15981 TaxID=518636 RepID=C0D9E7_9FIRM|nr:arylsulfatase [[Clostridium] asparagiforme DSM 15981]